jgi:mono/diheme cytochrome c family protein
MLKHLLLITFAAVVVVGIGYADQSKSKVVIPVDRTAVTDGKQMYVSYCAPCHGLDGKGNGEVASELRRHPTDLTVLSKNNKGRFPDMHILAVLQFGTDVPAHGTAQMPVWGPILGNMDHTSAQTKLLRMNNLSSYLKSIQEK